MRALRCRVDHVHVPLEVRQRLRGLSRLDGARLTADVVRGESLDLVDFVALCGIRVPDDLVPGRPGEGGLVQDVGPESGVAGNDLGDAYGRELVDDPAPGRLDRGARFCIRCSTLVEDHVFPQGPVPACGGPG
jgi:hypothetical protein